MESQREEGIKNSLWFYGLHNCSDMSLTNMDVEETGFEHDGINKSLRHSRNQSVRETYTLTTIDLMYLQDQGCKYTFMRPCYMGGN